MILFVRKLVAVRMTSLALMFVLSHVRAETANLVSFSQKTVFPSAPVKYLLAADINGDRKADLLAANGVDTISVFIGNGDGTFQDAVSYGALYDPFGLAVGDFNGDSVPDLVAADEQQVTLLQGTSDGTFETGPSVSAGPEPISVVAADFNRDGKLDALVANATPSGGMALLLGNGDGTFQPELPISNSKPAWNTVFGDFNGDGNIDFATVEDTAGLVQYLGNGNGTFKPEIRTGASIVSASLPLLAAGDFNNDGKSDVVAVSGQSGAVVLLGSDGGLQRTAILAAVPNPGGLSSDHGGALADFNGDGKLDLAILHSQGPKGSGQFGCSILLGNGDGTFADPIHVASFTQNVNWLACADLDDDGKPDLVVSSQDPTTPQQFYISTFLNTSAWPGARLSAQKQGNSIVLSWPLASTGFILESTSSFGASAWQQVNQSPVEVNGSWQATISLTDRSRMFRLRKP